MSWAESVEDDEGRLILSKGKAEKVKGWQKVMVDTEEGDVVEGRVMKQVKGGYMVDVDGVEGFADVAFRVQRVSSENIMANRFNFSGRQDQ